MSRTGTSIGRQRFERLALPAAVAAAACLAWHWLVVKSGTRVFPAPLAVLEGAAALARSGQLPRYVRDSLFRAAAGYFTGVITAVPVGIAMGRSPRAMTALNPVIQLLRPISPIAWIPISILIFGISNVATVFLIWIAVFFPTTVSTASATMNIAPIYSRAGINFGCRGPELFFRVLLPAMLPELLVGLRISLGTAWQVLVAAEMIAVDSGLGYMIMDSRNAGKRYDLVVAGMILIGLTGLLLDALIRQLEQLPQARWGFRQ